MCASPSSYITGEEIYVFQGKMNLVISNQQGSGTLSIFTGIQRGNVPTGRLSARLVFIQKSSLPVLGPSFSDHLRLICVLEITVYILYPCNEKTKNLI